MPVQVVKLLDSAVNINVNLHPAGSYDGDTTYNAGDVVEYQGSAYIALQTTTGNLPTNTTYWQLLAEKGDTGAAGPQGPQGEPGETGPQGDDGRTILNGSGAPSAGEGADGDFYIDTSNNEIYGPKTSGSWGSGTSIVGPQGIQGETGPQGEKGDTGDPGVVQSVVAGENVSVDSSDPANPIVSSTSSVENLNDIEDVNLTTPTNGQVLTYDNGEWINQNSSGGGRPHNADIVVAPSGGDYTTLADACSNASSGDTIFIEKGTYVETTAPSTLGKTLRIIGQDMWQTIIDLDGNDFRMYGDNCVYENFTISRGTGDSGSSVIIDSSAFLCHRMRFFDQPTNSNTYMIFHIDGDDYTFDNCIFDSNNTSSVTLSYRWYLGGNRVRINNSYFFQQPGNTNGNLNLDGAGNIVSGCKFFRKSSGSGYHVYLGDGNATTITGCYFYGGTRQASGINMSDASNCNVSAIFENCSTAIVCNGLNNNIKSTLRSCLNGIDMNSSASVNNVSLSGTGSDGGTGVDCDGDNNAFFLTLNTFTTGINLTAGADNNVLVGNVALCSTGLSDSGSGNNTAALISV